MPASFLDRLLGRASASPEVGEARAELERLAQDHPSLAHLAGFLRDVLPVLFAHEKTVAAPPISTEQAAAKLAGGIPLLRGEALELDQKQLRRRWRILCAALDRQETDKRGQAIAAAVRGGRLDSHELLQETLAGRTDAVHERANQLGLDAALTATILRLALFPLLSQVSVALSPLRSGARWEQGYCPICGSWPLLAELRGLEQLRFLRCGLCGTDWEYPRLQCPFCGTREHQVLGYFHSEGEEAKYRAATCDACRGYVKTVSTLGALSGPRLLVTDLATLHLDLAAAERGYTVSP